MSELWNRDCAVRPFISFDCAAQAVVKRLSASTGYAMPDQAVQNSYDYWEAQLRGEEPDLPLNVPMFGRYWRRQRDGVIVGVAIDPGDADEGDVTPTVRIAKQPPFDLVTTFAVEDFCEAQFSWFCRNAVTHEAYLHWWKTGEWPDGAIKEKPKAARGKKAAEPPQADHAAPPAAVPVAEDRPGKPSAAPGITVRTYAALGCPGKAEAFYARAIRYSGSRETVSVGFYGETAESATAKALAWVEAERAKPGRSRKVPSPEQSATAA